MLRPSSGEKCRLSSYQVDVLVVQRDPDRFKQSAFLKRKKKDNIYPEQFDIRGNEQEAEIIFAFPRGDEITLDDKNVELEVKLGQMTVKRKFKLQDMVWDGKLEL